MISKDQIELIHDRDFGKNVFNALRTKFGVEDIEQTQLIGYAGGAVASMVIEMLGLDIPIAYNDLDVWHYASEQYNYEAITFKQTDLVVDELASCADKLVREGYMIYKTERQGLINTITVSTDSMSQLISGFDINNVQCGVSGDGTLYFTEAFLSFLSTPTLKVVTYNTVTNSFIRLMSKSKELGIAIAEGEIEGLLDCIALEQMVINSRHSFDHAGTLFGGIKRAKLLSAVSKQDLLKLGVKVQPIPLVKGFHTQNIFGNCKDEKRTVCFFRLVLTKQRKVVDILEQKLSKGVHPRIRDYIIKIYKSYPENIPFLNFMINENIHSAEYFNLLSSRSFRGATNEMWRRLDMLKERYFVSIVNIQSADELGSFVRNLEWLRDQSWEDIEFLDRGKEHAPVEYQDFVENWFRMSSEELLAATSSFMKQRHMKMKLNDTKSLTELIRIPKVRGGQIRELTNEFELYAFSRIHKDSQGTGAGFERLKNSSDMVFEVVVQGEVSSLFIVPNYDDIYYSFNPQQRHEIKTSRHLTVNGLIVSYRVLHHYGYQETTPSDESRLYVERFMEALNESINVLNQAPPRAS